ncbi:alpha/beta-hydrolase, partial [Mollisia scopiformis]
GTMSRLALHIKAIFFRALQSIFTFYDLYLSQPIPQRASFTRRINSTISSNPGSFDLLFFTPPSYTLPSTTKASPPIFSTSSTKKHPLLINFHGGGFTIGHARDDPRFATSITTQTSAVVVSVNYRFAPSYPFPTAIEDGVSAILWLWRHADEYNLDISRTALSGFSGGGNLAYAVAIRLQQELEQLRKEGKLVGEGKIVSLVIFYGSVDWTQTRQERDASNPNLIPTIPPSLFKVFDEAYLYPMPADMRDPLLSPGLASDEVLRNAFPERLMMVNCGGDQLLAESEKFRERLVGLGKRVDGGVVEGVGHAWDKKATFGRGDVKRDEAYAGAVKHLNEVWA